MAATAPTIVVHGGAGSTVEIQDGCATAAARGMATLTGVDNALDAAIHCVVAMEDDGRFNAGRGSVFGVDGRIIEMSAAVMDSTGVLGSVAALQRVRNPVLVARAVADTPHWQLAGEGAERFARACGFAEYYDPSDAASERHAEMMAGMTVRSDKDPISPYRLHWNYPGSWDDAVKRYGSGTVSAVVRDSRGNFAVATSTGGCAPALFGRIGDTPVIGCGFYAGPKGAVAATGIGEYIVRQLLAKTVYDWIEQDVPLKAALDRGIALFKDDISVGLIGITDNDAAASSNRDMAAAFL